MESDSSARDRFTKAIFHLLSEQTQAPSQGFSSNVSCGSIKIKKRKKVLKRNRRKIYVGLKQNSGRKHKVPKRRIQKKGPYHTSEVDVRYLSSLRKAYSRFKIANIFCGPTQCCDMQSGCCQHLSMNHPEHINVTRSQNNSGVMGPREMTMEQQTEEDQSRTESKHVNNYGVQTVQAFHNMEKGGEIKKDASVMVTNMNSQAEDSKFSKKEHIEAFIGPKIKNECILWYQTLPLNPQETESVKNLREIKFKDLVDTIFCRIDKAHNEGTLGDFKDENKDIQAFLDTVGLQLTGEIKIFKDLLRENLSKKVEDICKLVAPMIQNAPVRSPYKGLNGNEKLKTRDSLQHNMNGNSQRYSSKNNIERNNGIPKSQLKQEQSSLKSLDPCNVAKGSIKQIGDPLKVRRVTKNVKQFHDDTYTNNKQSLQSNDTETRKENRNEGLKTSRRNNYNPNVNKVQNPGSRTTLDEGNIDNIKEQELTNLILENPNNSLKDKNKKQRNNKDNIQRRKSSTLTLESDSDSDNCVNKNDNYCYDGLDLLGRYRRKIKRKRKSINGINGVSSQPLTKKIIPNDSHCKCANKFICHTKRICSPLSSLDMEKEINYWLTISTFLQENNLTDKNEILQALTKRLSPYLSQQSDCIDEATLIKHISKIFNDLPIRSDSKVKNINRINFFASELAKRLICFQSRLQNSEGEHDNSANLSFKDDCVIQIGQNEVLKADLRYDLGVKVENCLSFTSLTHIKDIKEEITDVLMKRIENIRFGIYDPVVEEIQAILKKTKALNETEVTNVTNSVIQRAKSIIITIKKMHNTQQIDAVTSIRQNSEKFTIYTSEHEKTPSFLSEKNKNKSETSPNQVDYIDKIAAVVKTWSSNLLKKFNIDTTQDINEEMIYELANRISEQVKSDSISVKDTILTLYNFIHKWVVKNNISNDLQEIASHTQGLLDAIQKISNPNLTKLYKEQEKQWESFVTNDKKLLEAEILIWLREQPSDIYVAMDHEKRQLLIQKFVSIIYPKITNKNYSDVNIVEEAWLAKILKPEKDYLIDDLVQSIDTRIHNILQIKSVEDKPAKNDHVNKPKTIFLATSSKTITRSRLAHKADTEKLQTQVCCSTQQLQPDSQNINQTAYQILKPNSKFNPLKLSVELDYVEDISDWLRKLPINSTYNTVGNKHRINFIIDLAKKIADLEVKRILVPDDMSCDRYLAGIIRLSMEKLPFLYDPKDEMMLLIDRLMLKISERRNKTVPGMIEQSASQTIEEKITEHSLDFADDKLKLEVWSARILQEIQTLVQSDRCHISGAVLEAFIKYCSQQLEIAKGLCDSTKKEPVSTDTNDLDRKTPLDKSMQNDGSLVIQHVSDTQNDAKEKSILSPSSSALKKNKATRCVSFIDEPLQTSETIEKDQQTRLEENKKDGVLQPTCEIERKVFLENVMPEVHSACSLDDSPLKNELTHENKSSYNRIKNLNLDNEQNFKENLLEDSLRARISIREDATGDNYKQDLKDSIDLTLPLPFPVVNKKPGFELFKNYIVDMFILDNFDQDNSAVKLKYAKQIKSKIDTYLQDAQARNAIAIPQEHLYSYLYSSLYNTDVPEEIYLKILVQKIKTKCEIEDWLDSLPIERPVDKFELLVLNRKEYTLAGNICQIEEETDDDEELLNEIIKWFNKLPFMINNLGPVNTFANQLIKILHDTRHLRKYPETHGSIKSHSNHSSEIEMAIHEMFQKKVWFNQNAKIDLSTEKPKQKSADVILNILDNWCSTIPVPPMITKDEAKSIKEYITTKIIIKISELNSQSHIFNEDQLYGYLLGQEIGKLLDEIPKTWSDKLKNKDALKKQLIDKIKSVKPLITEEKARYEYKKNLEHIINNVIVTPLILSPEQVSLIAATKEDMVNDFIEYQYNRNDEDGKNFYKKKILQSLLKYNLNVFPTNDVDIEKLRIDSTFQGNKLICELSKIVSPGDSALKEEVEEIRIKEEITEFFDKVSIPVPLTEKNLLRNLVKNCLAKQLNYIEKMGYNKDNENKMKTAIVRALDKLHDVASDSQIEAFITTLKENVNIRRAAPPKKLNVVKNSNLAAPILTPMETIDSVPSEEGTYESNEDKQNINAHTHNQPASLFSSYTVLKPFSSNVNSYTSEAWNPKSQAILNDFNNSVTILTTHQDAAINAIKSCNEIATTMQGSLQNTAAANKFESIPEVDKVIAEISTPKAPKAEIASVVDEVDSSNVMAPTQKQCQAEIESINQSTSFEPMNCFNPFSAFRHSHFRYPYWNTLLPIIKPVIPIGQKVPLQFLYIDDFVE